MRRTVNFWKGLVPLLRRFCREHGVSFNRAVNLAVEAFLGGCDVERLRLEARLALLRREERELRQSCEAMLRSGGYLRGYVERVLMQPGRPQTRLGERVPLGGVEREAFLRIAARREQIAREIAELELKLLKDVEPFKLDEDGSCVKKKEGGEKLNE